jgi:hypothetical protein
VLPTLPEYLHELVLRVEGNISEHRNRPKIENRTTPVRRETPRKHVGLGVRRAVGGLPSRRAV